MVQKNPVKNEDMVRFSQNSRKQRSNFKQRVLPDSDGHVRKLPQQLLQMRY